MAAVSYFFKSSSLTRYKVLGVIMPLSADCRMTWGQSGALLIYRATVQIFAIVVVVCWIGSAKPW